MSLIHIGLSGTRAAQASLAMAARNTANLGTPGYTRQGVMLTARQNGGVDVQSAIRFADIYKTQQKWYSHAALAQQSASASYFNQLEKVMNLEDGSVKMGLDGFFKALDAVSADPTSGPLREQVIGMATTLTQSFNNLRHMMTGQLDTLRQQSSAAAGQINSLAQTVADLNQKIAEAQGTGVVPSELIDQRDEAIDQISGLVEIRVIRQPSGAIDLTFAGGPPLVAGPKVGQVEVAHHLDGTFSVNLELAGTRYPLQGAKLGGTLGGLAAFSEGVLQPQMEGLKTLAGEIANRFNAQLTAGFGTDGKPGQPLFTFDPVSGVIGVNASISHAQLGFSSDPATPGNSDNLLALIALRNEKITVAGLGEVSIGDTYTMLVGRLGSASQQNQAALLTALEIRKHAESDWLAVSGVDKDEEAVNISEYLKVYQANMKVIAIAKDLFDTTLSSF
ncbi:flagellar hook-associated protein FlgK [Paraburkholderia bonniea]|uniref:flagellar hook-associated protein FlgK n=1 Tax=Paraburkholderia bonniea TaxID=2152891 RepID=UPI00129128AB|nr:flagellar hook-associated protein FlgK [Paraburkholderia bonniea]WJF90797.1 flagellar hook-associated protein FlgK [Paraburkholderia bonniea]WJF94111.1 flagellar hook-associated protein FlgK [Paraburkholderia bonniea]